MPLFSIIASAAVAASVATPAPERMPSYRAALEAIQARSLHPVDGVRLEAGALAAVRSFLSTPSALVPVPYAAQAGSPEALLALVPADKTELKKQLENKAIEGMLSALGDADARLVDMPWAPQARPAEVPYVGVGIRFQMIPEGLLVDAVTPGGPAEEGGLGKGDVVVAVDGRSLAGAMADEASQLIRGAAGTHVRLTLRREGQAARELVLHRRVIGAQTAAAPAPVEVAPETREGWMEQHLIDDRVLYLKPNSDLYADYRRTTARALDQFKGVQGLVLDLRGYQGVLAQQVPSLVGAFGGKGPLFRLTDRAGQTVSFSAESSNAATARLPMAVLIDSRTGAAGELLAYGLKTGRAVTLVGEKSAGRSGIQSFMRLPNGMFLGWTTHRAEFGNGRAFEGTGMAPDVVARMRPGTYEERHPRWATMVPKLERRWTTDDLPLEGALEFARDQRSTSGKRP